MSSNELVFMICNSGCFSYQFVGECVRREADVIKRADDGFVSITSSATNEDRPHHMRRAAGRRAASAAWPHPRRQWVRVYKRYRTLNSTARIRHINHSNRRRRSPAAILCIRKLLISKLLRAADFMHLIRRSLDDWRRLSIKTRVKIKLSHAERARGWNTAK